MDPKPAFVVDREREWAALASLVQRPRPELAFVLGRRRIGKSHVLSRFAEAARGVYHQATRQTETDQRAQLARLLGEHFQDPALQSGMGFDRWEQLLDYVTRRARDEPLVLVIDEFPYLVDAAPALPSVLQRFWDHEWPETQLKLVLSGSFITAMSALEGADQPLFGRRTRKLVFGPFDFADATAFLDGYDPLDQLRAYATFGNLPGNLVRVDPSRSLGENVAEHHLDPTGALSDQGEHLLDAFLPEGRVHQSILAAVATGDRTWKRISSRLGVSGGGLLRPLRWLGDMHLLHRVVPLTERNPDRSRRALYRLADPYVAFWHTTVAPLLRDGSLARGDPARLWTERVEPRLPDLLGPVFETVCAQFVARTDRLPFRPLRVGTWWDARHENEVDIVAHDDDHLLVAECKLGPIGRAHLTSLRQRARLLEAELGGTRHLHVALFTARGEVDDAVRQEVEAGRAHLFTLEDVARA